MRENTTLIRRTTTRAVVAAITCVSLLHGAPSEASADTPKAKVSGEKRASGIGHKPFNASFALGPAGPLLKGFQWSAQMRSSKSFSHGLRGSWVSTDGDAGQSAYGYGVQYHLQGGDVMDDGPIVDTALAFILAHPSTPGEGSDLQKGVRLSTSLNWQWVHDYGFTIRAGAGLGGQHEFDGELEYLGTIGSVAVPLGGLGTLHPFLDARVAWAF